MANRRMFALTVTDSGEFQSMPLSTQAIYFHLGMHADDDGFVGNPKQIMRMLGGSDDEIRLLVAKGFVIPFNSGVCVIRHWKVNNDLKKDRYHETIYDNEMKMLTTDRQKRYNHAASSVETKCFQDVSELETEARLGKVRQDQHSEGEDSDCQAQMAVIRYCQNAMIFLSDTHMGEIADFLNDGIGADMQKHAVDLTIENGKRAWNYTRTILARWRDEGIRTLEAAMNDRAAFKAKKAAPEHAAGARLYFDD